MHDVRHRLALAGAGRPSSTTGMRVIVMPIATINPATGEVVKKFDALPPEQIDAAIGRSAEAFRALRATSFDQRAGWLRAAADLLEAEQGDLAALLTLEMGKTLTAAKAEVAK